jgi:hypothetical protein
LLVDFDLVPPLQHVRVALEGQAPCCRLLEVLFGLPLGPLTLCALLGQLLVDALQLVLKQPAAVVQAFQLVAQFSHPPHVLLVFLIDLRDFLAFAVEVLHGCV